MFLGRGVGQELGPSDPTFEYVPGVVSLISLHITAQQATHVRPGGLALRARLPQTRRAACVLAWVEEV